MGFIMPTASVVSAVLQGLLFPPGLAVVLLLLALLFRRQRRLLLLNGLILLYFSSIPATVGWLRGQLEVFPPLSLQQMAAEAIVVLGADRSRDVPEYGGDTIAGFGLERLRYAAWLHRKTGLPLLVSGGSVYGEPVSEAQLMRNVLTGEFGVEVRWIEGNSMNTYENARFSSRILKSAGIGEVLLVTSAWHMPRALQAFRYAGMKVVPAPTGFHNPPPASAAMLAWIPNAASLSESRLALREFLGRAWYRFCRYRDKVS